jgi:hypothetical protein
MDERISYIEKNDKRRRDERERKIRDDETREKEKKDVHCSSCEGLFTAKIDRGD